MLYGQKVIGTGPFEFVERKVGSYVLYKRVENHWRQTPEYKELEFRWVPEGVTRLATLLAEEVHISDVDRAVAKGSGCQGNENSSQQVACHAAPVVFWRHVFCHPTNWTRKYRLWTNSPAGNEQGDQSQCPGAGLIRWQGAARCAFRATTRSWMRSSGRDLESRLGQAFRGSVRL